MAIPSSPVKVLQLGVGSIGAVYLYQLLKAGCEVTAVCRSNFTHVQKHGFNMSSLRYGNVKYRPSRTVRDISECRDSRFDYILVSTKHLPDIKPSLPDMLRPVLKDTPNTAIVLAQNGIMIEEDVAKSFPDNPVLSGVVYLPAVQTAPGVIEYPEMLNLLEIGTYPSNAPPRHKQSATAFAELMISGGGGAQVHEDIQISRWTKLLMNAAWNPICALTLCSDGDFLQSSPFADDLAWETMMEVLQLAEKIGVKGISVEDAKNKIEISRQRSRTNTGREMSMLQDIRRGKPFEVEAILGNLVRLARRHEFSMTRVEMLYTLLKARYQAQTKTRHSHVDLRCDDLDSRTMLS